MIKALTQRCNDGQAVVPSGCLQRCCQKDQPVASPCLTFLLVPTVVGASELSGPQGRCRQPLPSDPGLGGDRALLSRALGPWSHLVRILRAHDLRPAPK